MTKPESIPDRTYLTRLARDLEEPGTLGKLILWIKLKCGRVPGFTFVHDFAVGGHSVDFYCPDVKLGIDVVASDQDERLVDGTERRSALEAHGIVMLTFTEAEIRQHIDDVLEHIQILVTAFDRMTRAG
jgi:very-short-patch-repair endonuclease